MKAKYLIGLCVLALTGQLACAADKPVPPTRTVSRTTPGNQHTKASSMAPREHSASRVYGEPIQPPILKQAPPKKPSG